MKDAEQGILSHESDDPATFEAGYQAGEYLIRKIDPARDTAYAELIDAAYNNATISVDVRVADDNPDGAVMLACRWERDSQSGYRLDLRPHTGAFYLSRLDDRGVTPLAAWYVSLMLRPISKPNRIELTCSGETIIGRINGHLVAAVSDGTYAWGQVWVGTGSPTGSLVDARFTNLVVTAAQPHSLSEAAPRDR